MVAEPMINRYLSAKSGGNSSMITGCSTVSVSRARPNLSRCASERRFDAVRDEPEDRDR